MFAVLQSILTPWFLVMSRKYANALTGAVGLVSTVAALFVATLVGDGLTISGTTRVGLRLAHSSGSSRCSGR